MYNVDTSRIDLVSGFDHWAGGQAYLRRILMCSNLNLKDKGIWFSGMVLALSQNDKED